MNFYLFLAAFSVFCAAIPGGSMLATHFLTPFLWAQATFFALLFIKSCLDA